MLVTAADGRRLAPEADAGKHVNHESSANLAWELLDKETDAGWVTAGNDGPETTPSPRSPTHTTPPS
jgi:hypothetical protein